MKMKKKLRRPEIKEIIFNMTNMTNTLLLYFINILNVSNIYIY